MRSNKREGAFRFQNAARSGLQGARFPSCEQQDASGPLPSRHRMRHSRRCEFRRSHGFRQCAVAASGARNADTADRRGTGSWECERLIRAATWHTSLQHLTEISNRRLRQLQEQIQAISRPRNTSRSQVRKAGLGFRKRLFKVGSPPRRIDSPNKAREIPHFTQVAPEQAVCFLQCGFIVAAINNVRRPGNAPILTKLVHAINCHAAPEAQQTRFDARSRAQARQRVRRFYFGESPDFPTFIICKYLRQISGGGARAAHRPKNTFEFRNGVDAT